MLISHHWERRGEIDWMLDRGISGMVIMSQASTRDRLSSDRDIIGSGTGDREGYWAVLTSLDRDHGVKW